MDEKSLNKRILLIYGIIATTMGFFTRLILRPLVHQYEINDFGFNGYGSNLFTAIGLTMFAAYFAKNNPIVIMASVTLGILAYETEQIWTSKTFDYVDIIATLLGFGLSVLILIVTSKKTRI